MKNTTHFRSRILCFFTFCSGVLFSNSIFAVPLFDESSILEIILQYDITKLQVDKEHLRKSGLNGIIKDVKTQKEYLVEVLSRGKGSFDCQQPQLKIKFDKKIQKNQFLQI